jgi:hypothetical protein
LPGRIVGQAQHHDIRLVERGGARGGVLAPLLRQDDGDDIAPIGEALAIQNALAWMMRAASTISPT